MKYLILSPYCINGTKNSGDDLIVKSLIKLLKLKDKEYECISIANSTLDKDIRDVRQYKAILMPAFRLSIQGQDRLEIRLKYMQRAIQYDIPIYCIACSFCVFPGVIEQTKYKLDCEEKALLSYVKHISTRSIFPHKFLLNNGIENDCIGDLALYDKYKIKKPLNFKGLNKIAISLPHNKNWRTYCYELKRQLEQNYNCEVYLVTQQFLYDNNNNFKNLYGESEILDWYKKIDLHIGFRLHGHLWFLRNRKPSILIAEDARSYSYLRTFKDLGIHASPNYILNAAKRLSYESLLLEKLNTHAIIDTDKVLNILTEALDNNFKITKTVLNKIDNNYYSYILPLVNEVENI